MELADLRTFVRIAETRSISAASRDLKQPKSSVSRALMRLEGAVGAALVDRSSRHLRLTDAGALLHPLALRILGEADVAQTAIDDLAEAPRGALRINAPYTFALGWIAPMVTRFVQCYPAVRVVLDIDNRVIDLHGTDVDLAIRIGLLADSDLVARRLVSVPLWVCASPAYLAARGTPTQPDELTVHAVVGRVDDVARWGFRTADGKRLEVALQPAMVIPEPAIAMAVVVDGGGIARLPDFIARDAVAVGQLIRLFPDLGPESVDVHAMYTSRRALSTKARVFIDALAEHLRDA